MGDGGPSVLTIVKIGLESAFGDGNVSIVAPITAVSLRPANTTVLDNAKRGVAAADFGAYQGPGRGEGSMEGMAYPEVFGMLAYAILGAGSASSATLGPTPPTMGIQGSYGGVTGLVGKGMCVTELTFRFNEAEGAATFSSSFLGKQVVSAGTLSVAHDVSDPMMGWHGYSTFGCITEGEFTFSREWGLLYCANTAAGEDKKYPDNAYAGPLSVTGRLTVDLTASSQIDRFLDKTQDALTVTFTDPESGGGSIGFAFNKIDYADAPLDIDISGIFTQVVYTIRGLYDLDALLGPVTITTS